MSLSRNLRIRNLTGHQRPDYNFPCPHPNCNRSFVTQGGLTCHRRAIHALDSDFEPNISLNIQRDVPESDSSGNEDERPEP